MSSTRKLTIVSLLLAGALSASGCYTSAGGSNDTSAATTTTTATTTTATTPSINSLSPADQQAGWKLLFDGKTTTGWRNYRKQTVGPGWTVIDGILTRSGDDAGDIITADKYRNFDFAIDWRVPEGGNSGVMYHANEEGDYIWRSAPEMQILDDERHADGKSPLTSAGSNFGLYPAPRGVVHPANQWNTARILVNGNHVEHWLNGTRLLEYEIGSADWKERVAKSKFATMPLYGKVDDGFIGLQDHGDKVEFRNIKIRVLP
ncbi:MAG: DUF1080 domain-containing protein [Gemmatimonadales bacterium]